MIAATSIDCKIAIHPNHFSDWTSPEDKDLLHELLDACDVVVVGNNTYKLAQKQLSKRNCVVFSRSIQGKEKKNKNLLYCNPANTEVTTILKKYQTVAVLGGTQVYTYFFDKNLLDEAYLTIEPIVFGKGLELFNSVNPKQMKCELVEAIRLNRLGSVLLHYKLNK